MNEKKALAYLGLAEKAGKIAGGEFSAGEALKKGRAKAVVVAADASANTKKKFHDKCAYREVPLYELSDKADLGRAVGKEMRAVCAVLDENLASALEKALHEDE